MTVVGKNFIFIHVPKSAGQSVTSRLGGPSRDIPAHAPLSFLQPQVRADRFTFGFVRNPWDRMVSLYSFLCTKRIKAHESATYQEHIRQIGFEEWLFYDAFFMHQDQAWRTEELAPMQQRSQMFWLEGCDFIGRVENLEDDFAAVAVKIDLRPRFLERVGLKKPIPHRNRSRREKYQGYYSDESRAFVERHFAPEIEKFGYTF